MKKSLIVIDMQNDFIDGSLGTKEAEAIVPKVREKIKEYAEAGYQIIFTRDTHNEDYLDTSEGKKLPVKHCIKDTKGWEIAAGLVIEDAIIIDKPNFGYADWKSVGFGKCQEVELVGLCTDICVISNALLIKAQYPDIDIKVDAACCAGVSVDKHLAALKVMESCQIDVINS